MSNLEVRRVRGLVSAALAGLVPILMIAFVIGPPKLAGGAGLGDSDRLETTFRTALVDYWQSGDRGWPPAMQRLVDYWFRWHMIKVAITALLLIVLITLTIRLWRAFLRNDRGDRRARSGEGRTAAIVSAGVALPLLALGTLAVLMANITSSVAPFASLLPFLVDGDAPDAALAGTLEQARAQLAGSHRTDGHAPPALDVIVGEFGRYHRALAVAAAVVVVALASLTVLIWRARRAAADRRTRRVLGWFAVSSLLSSLLMAIALAASVTNALDPAPAFLAFLNGSF